MKILDIGCGTQPIMMAYKVDIRHLPHLDKICKVEKLIFPPNSFDKTHARHLLQYLPYASLNKALSEMVRVTKMHGTIELIVPNAKYYIDNFNPGSSYGPSCYYKTFEEFSSGQQQHAADFVRSVYVDYNDVVQFLAPSTTGCHLISNDDRAHYIPNESEFSFLFKKG